jgi:hypothetical protein
MGRRRTAKAHRQEQEVQTHSDNAHDDRHHPRSARGKESWQRRRREQGCRSKHHRRVSCPGGRRRLRAVHPREACKPVEKGDPASKEWNKDGARTRVRARNSGGGRGAGGRMKASRPLIRVLVINDNHYGLTILFEL